jgi:hypothetical protein
MSKTRPKTGERREVRQPLKIDKLPLKMRDRIERERQAGRTWTEIEESSPSWAKEWGEVPQDVQALFPGKRLPHSNLARWYDIRVEQVNQEMANEAERARQFSGAIAKLGDVEKLGDAAVLALSDVVFSVMRARGRDEYAKACEALGYLSAKLTDAKSKKVRADAESKRIAILEGEIERKKKQLDKATNEAANKLGKGKAVTLDQINSIRERVFGLPPVPHAV